MENLKDERRCLVNEGKKEERKEGGKEERKEGRKERRKEGRKEAPKEGKEGSMRSRESRGLGRKRVDPTTDARFISIPSAHLRPHEGTRLEWLYPAEDLSRFSKCREEGGEGRS